jgi:asparagine synthase (glutamine-hydrolysing)
MCGIVGVASSIGERPTPDRAVVERLRDLMRHRGPDGAGYWQSERSHVRFGHRRLAVIDPSAAGAQPMVSADGCALVYNGELYNDAELRSELARLGVVFRSSCDTETVLYAMRQWGTAAIRRLRGMFALAFYDPRRELLTLARDPLGIKPLYWWRGEAMGRNELAFASEILPLLHHPRVADEPDVLAISAYLTTIRTTMGTRTLFRDIRAVTPGEVVEFDLHDRSLGEKTSTVRIVDVAGAYSDTDGRSTRQVVLDAAHRHLRSDVPTCCLLSGGLDSSILATIAGERTDSLWTYSSGYEDGSERGDLHFAQQMSEHLHTRHTAAPITAEMFRERWLDLVSAAQVPLSTPNEIAINEVSRRLRADGRVVTLSGEGADEIFGGYEAPLRSAAEYVAAGGTDGGLMQLRDAAWIPLDAKEAVLSPSAWRAIEEDSVLIETARREFEALRAERDDEPIQAHLRSVRRINLAGLLLRLDSATMRESVESRTPFADVAVAAYAEGLPINRKYRSLPTPTTKIALREAFAMDLPVEIVARPKASFPLPFQEWISDQSETLRGSSFAREVFNEAAIQMVADRPRELWRLAWPMMNIAMWGRRWAA